MKLYKSWGYYIFVELYYFEFGLKCMHFFWDVKKNPNHLQPNPNFPRKNSTQLKDVIYIYIYNFIYYYSYFVCLHWGVHSVVWCSFSSFLSPHCTVQFGVVLVHFYHGTTLCNSIWYIMVRFGGFWIGKFFKILG